MSREKMLEQSSVRCESLSPNTKKLGAASKDGWDSNRLTIVDISAVGQTMNVAVASVCLRAHRSMVPLKSFPLGCICTSIYTLLTGVRVVLTIMSEPCA